MFVLPGVRVRMPVLARVAVAVATRCEWRISLLVRRRASRRWGRGVVPVCVGRPVMVRVDQR